MAALDYEARVALQFGSWVPVQSSWLRAVQYDAGRRVLTVEFGRGAFCEYPDVGWELVEELALAPSKGKWATANLKGRDYVLLSFGK